ncbi:hypothetical protein [Ktedonospora formicarum]|uniref:Uncharacterized protein n=1 Tax=Ktedonospora formicarum TaxID=2778364 RepID=A0A8J3MY86_9CHLR|nr:hypothetical protein [Ktedonospora formicarum]GHO50533.1 hypothetical protein KSX_86960 [Ktedonospora formicarum]
MFQPIYATSLNLIEPWWKPLHSLALKGRRFESWQEIAEAVEQATSYWNGHRHPYVWGRRRHQPRRPPLPVLLWPPLHALLSGCTTKAKAP